MVEKERFLTIGQFADMSQLSQKALRLYHQLDILVPARIDADSGYRYYDPAQLEQARLIRLLRYMEMPLADIRSVCAARMEKVGDATAIISRYLESAEERLRNARKAASLVYDLLNNKERQMSFEVEVEQVNEQTVLSIIGRVRVKALDGYIRSTLRKLADYAGANNTEVADAPFGIYHGQINQNDDGPIEVCLPITAAIPSSSEVNVVQIPAGSLAAVDARGGECDFPAILGAYDAAIDWIISNGYETDGPPREIWYTSPGEEAHMRIAWPFKERA